VKKERKATERFFNEKPGFRVLGRGGEKRGGRKKGSLATVKERRKVWTRGGGEKGEKMEGKKVKERDEEIPSFIANTFPGALKEKEKKGLKEKVAGDHTG